MKRISAILIFSSLLTITGFNTVACSTPVTIVTQAGKTAYTADQIVVRVNELMNAAIQAHATNGLDIKTTRIIVDFAVKADTILAVTPSGWQSTVAIAWKTAKTKLGSISNPAVLAAISTVDVVLAAYSS